MPRGSRLAGALRRGGALFARVGRALDGWAGLVDDVIDALLPLEPEPTTLRATGDDVVKPPARVTPAAHRMIAESITTQTAAEVRGEREPDGGFPLEGSAAARRARGEQC